MPPKKNRSSSRPSKPSFCVVFDERRAGWVLQKCVADGTRKVLALYLTQYEAVEDCARLCRNAATSERPVLFTVYDRHGRLAFAHHCRAGAAG